MCPTYFCRDVLKAIGSDDAVQAYADLEKLTQQVTEQAELVADCDRKIVAKQRQIDSLAHVQENLDERKTAYRNMKALDALLQICILKKANEDEQDCQVIKACLSDRMTNKKFYLLIFF